MPAPRHDREPQLLRTVEKPVSVQVYEAVKPLKAEIKEINADITDQRKRLKEEGHESVNFSYCEKAAKLEPLAQAARKRDLDQMWRDFNLADPIADDLIERNLHATTSGRNGEPDEPDVEAEIPLPAAEPTENLYRQELKRRSTRKGAELSSIN